MITSPQPLEIQTWPIDRLVFYLRNPRKNDAAVDRMGSVDDGTSVADSDEEEHKHHFSIDTHVLHADHDAQSFASSQ